MLDGEERDALAVSIQAVLDEIKDPCSVASGLAFGLNEMGLVENVEVTSLGRAIVRLRLTAPFCHMIGFFKTEATRLALAFDGITSVELEADNGLDWSPSRMSPAARMRREQYLARMYASGPTTKSAAA